MIIIISGDKEKEPWPKSDYQNNFHEKDLTKRQEIVNDTLSSTTIKGDERSHESNDMFNTTSRKMFPICETVNRINVSHSTKVKHILNSGVMILIFPCLGALKIV